MKKNCNQILEKDYERYIIQLPWKIVLSGKTNRFIYSELEKKHPCFSDEWCFEKKALIKKSGLESDVIVMNKFTLSEYKQRFPGKKLYLEKIDKRTFASRDKLSLYLPVFLLLILIFVLIGMRYSARKKNVEILENKSVSPSNSYERKELIHDFMIFAEKNGCKISDLSWSSDGKVEILKANINGIFPEQLKNFDFEQKAEISNVLYKNEVPFFHITIKDYCAVLPETLATEKTENQKKINRSEIRQIFKDFKVELEEEKIRETEFKFFCKSYFEVDGKNFLEALSEFCKEEQLGISRLELNQLENKNAADGFSGTIVFDEKLSFENGIELEALAHKINLFVEKNKKSIESKISAQKKLSDSKAVSENFAKGIFLGEVLRNDGTKIRFYKNQEGKVVKEELCL